MSEIVWLLPLLFILHDMEEVIFAIEWKKQEKGMKKYIKSRFIPFGNIKDTSSFALGVYEELLILTLASLIGRWTGHYELWLGFLLGNIVHLIFVHGILVTLIYRRYVPGLVTAILTVIPCSVIFVKAVKLLQYSSLKLVLSIVIGLGIAFINLKVLHQCGPIFEKLLKLEGEK